MNSYKAHLESFNKHLHSLHLGTSPASLYTPIEYILQLGGKRLRPVLVMMAHELFSAVNTHTLHAATAVELFHNFSLLHDDIMDNAPLRRGKATVHEKFGTNTAILSGDAALVIAYEQLAKLPANILPTAISLFNRTAIGVCEGQQFDMEFETQNNVSVDEYLKMIELKTAVLLGCCMQLGAITAGAEVEDAKHCYNFGKHLGIAFQLQDDLLDTFGNPETFGKQPGGDIIANKKTFLLIQAMTLAAAEPALHNELQNWLQQKEFNNTEKVAAVTKIFKQLGVQSLAETEMQKQSSLADEYLKKIKVHDILKTELVQLINELMHRTV